MGLFDRLLHLHRVHNGRRPTEDLFTEVVAYLFQDKPEILLKWLKESLDVQLKECTAQVYTQKRYHASPDDESDSRVDMVVELENDFQKVTLIVESKVGSAVDIEQLQRYAGLLHDLSNGDQCHERILVLMTRDYVCLEEGKVTENAPDVDFKQRRWHQFYAFLNKQPTQKDFLIKEVKAYMKAHRMAQPSKFTQAQIMSMAHFPDALSLIEEILGDKVWAQMKTIFKTEQRQSFGRKDIVFHKRYIISVKLGAGLWCYAGFQFPKEDSDSDYPSLMVSLELDPGSKRRDEVIREFKKIKGKDDWVWYDEEGWVGITQSKGVQHYLAENNHKAKMEAFFIDALAKVAQLKKERPKLPWDLL